MVPTHADLERIAEGRSLHNANGSAWHETHLHEAARDPRGPVDRHDARLNAEWEASKLNSPRFGIVLSFPIVHGRLHSFQYPGRTLKITKLKITFKFI